MRPSTRGSGKRGCQEGLRDTGREGVALPTAVGLGGPWEPGTLKGKTGEGTSVRRQRCPPSPD